MGSVGGLLGTAGGAGGTGFGGPASASQMSTTNPWQLTTAYNNVQNSMAAQGTLLQALQAQNGLQNQSNVYNQLQDIAAGKGPNPAQAMLAQATGANTANQAALMAGQRGAAQNVGLIARQAAQQGAKNQQEAAGQSATMQAQQSMNAIAQSGGMAGTMAANQIGQTNANVQAQQAEQQNLLNAANAYNANQVSMQSNINNVNGQLANTQLQGQQAMIGGMMNGMGGMSGLMSMLAEGGDVDQDQDQPPTANFGDFKGSSTNETINASTPTFGSDAGAAALGGSSGGKSGGGGGGGSILGLLALLADGGMPGNAPQAAPSDYKGKSKFGAFVKGQQDTKAAAPAAAMNFGNAGADALYQGLSAKPQQNQGSNQPGSTSPGLLSRIGNSLFGPSDAGGGFTAQQMQQERMRSDAETMGGVPDQNDPAAQVYGNNKTEEQDASNTSDMPMAAEGGKVPALVSPGERYLPPQEVKKVVQGKKSPLQAGEKIPGTPKHPGNDYRNDTVRKDLDSGGFVIPNKILQGPNPHWEAMKFIKKNYKGGKV